MSAFIVSEIGVNWDGDRLRIPAFIDAAKATGASACKFQAFNAKALIARRGITDAKTIALLERCELSDADLDAISAHCKAIGFKWGYSVFDETQVERVGSRGAAFLKIGHKEAAWENLLVAANLYAFQNKIPCYASGEYMAGLHSIQWVHCIQEYPATSPPKLGKINNGLFGSQIGFSSHYRNPHIPASAALRGATYIEAHLSLATTEPEAAWSLNPHEFKHMVTMAREAEKWL